MSTPTSQVTPPPLPTDTTPSWATKAAFTIGAACFVAAPVVTTYSTTAAGI